jgi:hypothetical protein
MESVSFLNTTSPQKDTSKSPSKQASHTSVALATGSPANQDATQIYDTEDEGEDHVPLPMNRRNTKDSIELMRPQYEQEKRRRKRAHSIRNWFLGRWYSVSRAA